MQPGLVIDFSRGKAHFRGMDLVTIMAGVLLGNLLTVGLLFNIKKLDVPDPPLRNMVWVVVICSVGFLIALAVAQQTPAGL